MSSPRREELKVCLSVCRSVCLSVCPLPHSSSSPDPLPLSLCGVRIAGVQAGLCGCGGSCGAGGRSVQRLGAPSQILQGLQEGAPCSLLLQGRGTLLLHLCDFGEGDGLGLESGFAGSAGATAAAGGPLRHGQLLGELLHGGGQQVCGQHGEAHHFHLTGSHVWRSRRGVRRVCRQNQLFLLAKSLHFSVRGLL